MFTKEELIKELIKICDRMTYTMELHYKNHLNAFMAIGNVISDALILKEKTARLFDDDLEKILTEMLTTFEKRATNIVVKNENNSAADKYLFNTYKYELAAKLDGMTYVDFDGVILDTEPVLFREWRKNPDRHSLPGSAKIEYIQNQNWYDILHESEVINDSIYNLKHSNPKKNIIATKTHSLINEGTEKIKLLREYGVKNDIILIPYDVKKSDVIDFNSNILIDDGLSNLVDCEEHGGVPIFCDLDDDNYDPWHRLNEKNYPRTKSLGKYLRK